MKAFVAILAALFGVGALLFIASEPRVVQDEMTEAEVAQIKAEVLQAAEAWNDAFKDVDTDCEKATELLHPFYFVSFVDGERGGREAWFEYCSRVAANRASYDGEWTDTEVRVLSSDAAVFVGTYEYQMSYNDGSPTRIYPKASQKILFERTEIGWGITIFNNSNGPSVPVE